MKTYKYIAALLLTGVVVSCQNDDFISPAYENDPDAVRIQVNIAALQTRVNTDGNGDTWTNGDQIKVVNVSPNAISGKAEATYTYSNDSWSLDENSTYMVWADGTNDFQAYYPCTDGTSFSSFVLPKEQTDAERGVDKHFIGDADWMLAKESSPKTNVLPLTFSHQLVKVTVEFTAYKDEYTSDATVVDPVFTVPTTLTGITGKTLSVEDNSTTVNGLKTEGSNGLHSFTVVLLPGRYAADDTFLQLTVNGQPLTVKVGSNETLATKGLEAETAYLITFYLYSATSIGAYAFQGIGGVDITLYLLSEDDIDVTDAFKTEDGVRCPSV